MTTDDDQGEQILEGDGTDAKARSGYDSSASRSSSVTWDTGHNSGAVFGGDNNGSIYLGHAPEHPQPYERRRVRLLPITERGLQAGAAAATLVVFLTGYQSFSQLWSAWGLLPQLGHLVLPALWVYGFLGSSILAVSLLAALSIARNRTHRYTRLAFLPGLAGVRDTRGTRRLALVWNSGRCMRCGGKLRFYARATQSHEVYDSESHSWRRTVDVREPVAECVRNPLRHWWLLDPTDTDDLNHSIGADSQRNA